MLRVSPQVVTVAHYDLSQVPASWSSARLELPLRDLQPDPPEGTVRVYCFAGDGECSIDEALVGTLVGSQGGLSGEYPQVQMDVTAQLAEYLALGHAHLTLRFQSPYPSDDFDLGAAGGVDVPTLVVEP